MDIYIAQAQEMVVFYGAKLIGAVLILLVGIWLAKMISKSIGKLMTKRNVDVTLTKFTVSFVKILLIVFVVLASINQVGIETTSFVAILGAAGLAVGFALQGSLSNFAAGVMLIIFRPMRVGDNVEVVAVKGKVEQVGIFTSLVEGENDKIYIIPNSKLMSDIIVNHDYKKSHPNL